MNFPQKNQVHQLIFIRHGESIHNYKSEELLQKMGQNFKSSPEYRQIKFDPTIMDGDITEKGMNQAKNAIQKFNVQDVDVVVVSPLRRALDTCEQIFHGRNVKIFVEPLMSEILSSAVDVGSRLNESKNVYGKTYDFSGISQKQGELWYFQNIQSDEHKDLIKNKSKEGVSVHEATLEAMKFHTLENNKQLRARAQKLKKRLLHYLSLSKKKVALVGHSSMFQALTATQFNQKDQPVNGAWLQNCEPKSILIPFDN